VVKGMRAVVDGEAERNALGVHPAVTMPTLGRPREIEAGDALGFVRYDRGLSVVEGGGELPNLAGSRDQCARKRLGALGPD
jgi:hypothetical protein